MHVNRGLLGWGVFFIVMGAVPLAVQSGRIGEDVVGRAWQLWPLILVGIGLGLILRRTKAAVIGGLVVAVTCGLIAGSVLAAGVAPGIGFQACGLGAGEGSGDPFPEQAGTLGSASSVALTVNCGDLTVAPATGSAWRLTGTTAGGEAPIVVAESDRLAIEPPIRQGEGTRAGTVMDLELPTESRASVDLSVTAGSADVVLDGMRVTDVDVSVSAGDAKVDLGSAIGTGSVTGTVNAGSIELSLPMPEGTLSGDLSANAGSIELCVPLSAGLHVSSDSALGSVNVSGGTIEHEGDEWTTPGYASATGRIDLSVNANLGSVNVRMESSCG
jgi:hypothetical protein